MYTVKIKTLTPLWTGDANRKGETLRETGIIGSLRWWYEALIRGLGGTACDLTDTICDDKSRCDACELFGCTGWSRKFKLETIVDSGKQNLIYDIRINTRQKHKTKKGEKYLDRVVSGIMPEAQIVFIPLKEIKQDEWELLKWTLQIIQGYGALGARISQGNGIVKFDYSKLPSSGKSKIILNKNIKIEKDIKPNFKDFFCWKFDVEFVKEVKQLIDEKVFWVHDPAHNRFNSDWSQWKNVWDTYGFLPIAFHIRDTLRPLVINKNDRHKLFGEQGKGSQIFISHGYKKGESIVEFRIFGYNDCGQEKERLQKAINKDKLSEKLFSNDSSFIKEIVYLDTKTGEEIFNVVKRGREVFISQ
ncbi:MAG: hypothetical protein STSR0004_11390 [Peptococcaceae bacterium]